MSRVLVNGLNVRAGPSTNTQKVAHYDAGDIINSGNELIENEGRIWLKYLGGSGNYRYVCAINNDNSKYVEVPGHIPGPRTIGGGGNIPRPQNNVSDGWKLTAYCPCAQCCGKSDGITASGYHLKSSDHLQICAAPGNIPFHTVIKISGGWNGTVRVEDRGGAIKGKRLDIFCRTHQEANQFGVKYNCTISY
jgi:3D (Asp-Asp-Asp) domain-containing protein